MESYYNVNASNCGFQHGSNNSNCRPCDMQRPMPRTCNTNNVMQPRNDHQGKSVNVECVCKVNETESCHMPDAMEDLGYKFPIAMVYIPWQQWGEMYEPDCALMQGTIFKELNKIFCGVRC